MSVVRVTVRHPAGKGASGLLIELPGGAVRADPGLIVDVIRSRYGLDSALLRVVSADAVEVEHLGGVPSADLRWTTEDQAGPARPAWERPGWLRGLLAEVDRGLAAIGLERTGAAVQSRHTSITAMLRIPTTGGEVWLKQVLPIFAVEAPVVRWLETVMPGAVPRVLTAGADWWVSAPFPAACGTGPWPELLASLAEIQVASVERIGELRALGCRDRPLAGLADTLARIAARTDFVPPWLGSRLRASLPRFAALCAEIDALGFPAALVHSDLNHENVRWTGRRWFLFDWTDACLTHPVVDLALPLSELDPATRDDAVAAYRAVWSTVVPQWMVQRAVAAAPVIGAAHQAVSYEWIADAVDPTAGDESNAGQLLGLLRFWLTRVTEDC